MKKNKKYILTFLLLIFFLGNASFALAAGLVPCGTADNPCTLCYLIKGVKGVINWGLNIMIVAAVLAIFISGIMYIISAGDQGMMETAKRFMRSALIGVAIFLLAWLIVQTVFWILGVNLGNVVDGTGINWYEIQC